MQKIEEKIDAIAADVKVIKEATTRKRKRPDRLPIIVSKMKNEYLDDGSGFIQIPRVDVQWLIDEVTEERGGVQASSDDGGGSGSLPDGGEN